MPLSLYSAWLQPIRMYGGNGSGLANGASCLPASHLASYPSSQPHQQSQLGLNHLQGAAYPGHRVATAAAAARLLHHAAANFTDDSEDEGSMSPASVHDLSKSQHGKIYL